MTTAATTGIPKYNGQDSLVIVYSANVYGAEILRFYRSLAAAEAYCHFALADGVTIQYHAEPDSMILSKVIEAHATLNRGWSGKVKDLPDFVTHVRQPLTGELVPR